MTWLKRILLVGVLVYLGVCVSACALQDRFAFFPDASPAQLPDGSLAEMVEIETADGERLVAFSVAANDNCPTLLNFHGNAQHLNGLAGVADLYAENGMGFLAVAYRGYSGSTGKPSEAGVRRDGEAAYAYLMAQGVAPETLVIRGFSLGSSVAIGLAAEKPSAALILGAPFESGTRIGSEQMPFLPVGLLAGSAFRSDRLAANVDEPVLIIHGDADRIIPEAHSADLAGAFPGDVTRILVPGRGHNDLQDAGYERLIAGFISPLFPDCAPLQEIVR